MSKVKHWNEMPCIKICNTITLVSNISILHKNNSSLCKLHGLKFIVWNCILHPPFIYMYVHCTSICAIVWSDLYLPSKQLCPVRSFGQVHMYDPRVLRQVPLYMQGFRRHSSTSNIYIITEHVTCVSIYQNILCIIFFFIFSILFKKICSKEYSWFLLKSSLPFFFFRIFNVIKKSVKINILIFFF